MSGLFNGTLKCTVLCLRYYKISYRPDITLQSVVSNPEHVPCGQVLGETATSCCLAQDSKSIQLIMSPSVLLHLSMLLYTLIPVTDPSIVPSMLPVISLNL